MGSRRQAAMNKSYTNFYSDIERLQKAEVKTKKPKVDKSIKVPKLYDFQFYADFEAIQNLGAEIKKI